MIEKADLSEIRCQIIHSDGGKNNGLQKHKINRYFYGSLVLGANTEQFAFCPTKGNYFSRALPFRSRIQSRIRKTSEGVEQATPRHKGKG